MIATLSWAFLPTRLRLASRRAVIRRNQMPIAPQAPEMIKDGLPRREIGWQVAKGGSLCAECKRSHRRWRAKSEWVACRLWARKGDVVADTSTPHRDVIAGITGIHPFSVSHEPLPFPKHALKKPLHQVKDGLPIH